MNFIAACHTMAFKDITRFDRSDFILRLYCPSYFTHSLSCGLLYLDFCLSYPLLKRWLSQFVGTKVRNYFQSRKFFNTFF